MRLTLNTAIETEETFEFSVRAQAGKVIRAVLRAEHFPADAEVSLTMCDDAAIREMNREYRGIDKVTDVLSFPNLEFEAPADYAAIEDDPYGCTDPETGRVLLGDIVLNAARVKEQAKAYGHSELREFSFLIAHSALHLCGYDHIEPEDAARMEERQRIILGGMGITRDAAMDDMITGAH